MPIDIQQTETGELKLTAGDISLGESTINHHYDLLKSKLGDNRLDILSAVDAESFTNDDNPDALFAGIRRVFSKDGMKVISIKTLQDKVSINAPYK